MEYHPVKENDEISEKVLKSLNAPNGNKLLA